MLEAFLNNNLIMIAVVAVLAVLLLFGIIREVLQRIDAAQTKKNLPTVYRILNERLRRKFPEFANEFTVVSAQKMVEAREARDRDFSQWSDELVRRIDSGEELSEDDRDDFRHVPFSAYLRTSMSPEFIKHINSDVAREKLLSTIVSDAYYRGLGVKLRVWIDKDGNWASGVGDKTPPEDW